MYTFIRKHNTGCQRGNTGVGIAPKNHLKTALNRQYANFSAFFIALPKRNTFVKYIRKGVRSLAPLAPDSRSLRSLVPIKPLRRGRVPSPPPSILHGWGPAPPTLVRGSPNGRLIGLHFVQLSFFVTGAPAPLLTMRVHVLLSRYRSQHGRPLHPASVVYCRVRLL